MQKYNFDQNVRRRGTGCVKWDEVPEGFTAEEMQDVVPLWVADMDFAVAPTIQEAVRRRAEHPVFGYTVVGDEYYDAVISWFRRRHGWTIRREEILYTTGVVPAMSVAIKALTMPGERVLILSPDYNCFFSSIINNGCQVGESILKPTPCPSQREGRKDSSVAEGGQCSAAEGGQCSVAEDDHCSVAKGDFAPLPSGGARGWAIDWSDFESQCADEKTTVFLLCNPHNPTGRVWTREELGRMNDICLRHGVKVVSDEIHCELTMPGYTFQPFAAVSEACRQNSVILNSPSKSFNIAGLQAANIICANAEWRRRLNRAININEVCDLNPFGPVALVAAYNESEDWIDELCQYLWQNYLALCEFVARELPQLEVSRLEGTYLPWVDVSRLGVPVEQLCDRLLREGRVWVNPGTMYGPVSGRGYVRLNIACPRAQLMEGLRRIKRVVMQYE